MTIVTHLEGIELTMYQWKVSLLRFVQTETWPRSVDNRSHIVVTVGIKDSFVLHLLFRTFGIRLRKTTSKQLLKCLRLFSSAHGTLTSLR